jgi:iron(III) transport system ATP-binding protein
MLDHPETRMAPNSSPAAASPVAAAAPEHVRIKDLVKRFGAFTALQDINLDVRRGELVCFLGPSGCGKTTLLRAIAGLDRQDQGTIEIGGRDVSNLPPAARDFGIVFQSYALFPNLTIAANVGYGLVNKGMARAARTTRVTELLALVGLSDQRAKYPAQLSGGQQQRVALARALATSPSLLLLDEPLSALDARVRVRLREEIKSLQRRIGVTTIMVTHDQEEALAMADRIVVMNQGVIEQVGRPDEIYARPATAFVADFVGTMTFLDATVTGPGTVDVAGVTLASRHVEGVAPGQRVRIGIRPEEVRVGVADAERANAVEATIARIEYLGSFSRLHLLVQGAEALVLQADVPAAEARRMGLAETQHVRVVLPPEALRAFHVAGAA